MSNGDRRVWWVIGVMIGVMLAFGGGSVAYAIRQTSLVARNTEAVDNVEEWLGRIDVKLDLILAQKPQ